MRCSWNPSLFVYTAPESVITPEYPASVIAVPLGRADSFWMDSQTSPSVVVLGGDESTIWGSIWHVDSCSLLPSCTWGWPKNVAGEKVTSYPSFWRTVSIQSQIGVPDTAVDGVSACVGPTAADDESVDWPELGTAVLWEAEQPVKTKTTEIETAAMNRLARKIPPGDINNESFSKYSASCTR